MGEKDLAVIYDKDVFPNFSSKSFIVSTIIFRSLIHFEFTFGYDVRECSKFIFLPIAVKVSQTTC